MIASIVLPTLFAASGLLAFATLALAWRGHAANFREIRRQLAAVQDFREATLRIALTETRVYLPVARRGGLRRSGLPPHQPRPARRAAA